MLESLFSSWVNKHSFCFGHNLKPNGKTLSVFDQRCEDNTDTVRILIRHPEDGHQKADEISGVLVILKMVVHKKLQWLVKYFEETFIGSNPP